MNVSSEWFIEVSQKYEFDANNYHVQEVKGVFIYVCDDNLRENLKKHTQSTNLDKNLFK